MVAVDIDRSTSTMGAATQPLQLTTAWTAPPVAKGELTRARGAYRRVTGGQTGLDVDPEDRGREDELNQASVETERRSTKKEKPEPADNGDGSRVRSELARDLVRRAADLIPLVGEISLATHVAMLKRELSHAHDVLRPYAEEGNYLSIVTLVESAMAQLKWKDYTTAQVEAIREALYTGYQLVRVEHENYEQVRALLTRSQVDATPVIDLASLRWEDIEDDEEEEPPQEAGT